MSATAGLSEELEFLRGQIERHERSDPGFAEWLRGLRFRLLQVLGPRG